MSQTELERQLLARLRSGDEAAFAALVDDLQGRLLRLACSFCRTEAVAEEAVQETWIAVIAGIDRFEGRGTLRSSIFGILVSQARKRALREMRQAELGSRSGCRPRIRTPAPPTNPVLVAVLRLLRLELL
jgi:RNA polymerase sigma-70 factor (ECF subfamily)